MLEWSINLYKELTLDLRRLADPLTGVTSLEKRGTLFSLFLRPLLFAREGDWDEFFLSDSLNRKLII
jgi:hypothetical protein